MKYLKTLLITQLLFVCCSACAGVEYHWPVQGYRTYRIADNDGDILLIRDQYNHLAATMRLVSQGADYHDKTNIVSSTAYIVSGNVRESFRDLNKNAKKDGFFEDFERYEKNSNPNDLAQLNWSIYGLELTDKIIKEINGNKVLHIDFDSPSGMIYGSSKAWVPVSIAQDTPFSPSIDLSDAVISFDMRTIGIDTAIPGALSIQISANTYNPDLAQYVGYIGWRLQNYPANTFPWNLQPGLYDLPASGSWQNISFNTSDLVFNSTTEEHWLQPDFSDVSKCEIFLFQVPITEDGPPNDWVAAGSIEIDNISVGAENEKIAETPLDIELTVSNFYDAHGVQSVFFPGEDVIVELQAHKDGAAVHANISLQLYDSTFQLNGAASIVYDSADAGADITTLIGNSETEKYRFTVPLPKDAQEGIYYVFAAITAIDGTVLDTTGQDIAMDDRSELAYRSGCYVMNNISGNIPVASGTTIPAKISVSPSAEAVFQLDASDSFHNDSNYQIVTYEWDLNSDGIFEYNSSNPIISVTLTLPAFTGEYTRTASLRVTDNNPIPQSATTNVMLNFAKIGTLQLNSNVSGTVKTILYTDEYSYTGDENRRVTPAFSTSTWDALTEGEYILHSYTYDSTPFEGALLYMEEHVHVLPDQTTNVSLYQSTPYIENISIVNTLTGETIASTDSVWPGAPLNIVATVINPSAQPRECTLSALIDRYGDYTTDISAALSIPVTIAELSTQTITLPFSLPRPEWDQPDNYNYAVRLETKIHTSFIKTDSTDWQPLCSALPLPNPREFKEQISFSDIKWDLYDWLWQAGLYHKNVMFDTDGNLILCIRDYGGVGGQANSTRNNYHYGRYKTIMKASHKPTELPYGTVSGFFYYWENAEYTEVQEIDIEIRSLQMPAGSTTSYVDFTVHSMLLGEETISNITFACPVENIEEFHTYEFNWTPDEIHFYINGELAYTDDNQPAIVNNDNFAGRIPSQPGNIIFNHWSGQTGNTFSGTPPQGQGDSVLTVKDVQYAPLIHISTIRFQPSVAPIVHFQGYPSIPLTLLGKSNIADQWVELGTFSGNASYQFEDIDSMGQLFRWYKLQYEKD